jgi:membrane-bound acyltransferase YfiQ involved in biofilm formation
MVKILESTLNTSAAKKEMLKELDYMRCIACIAVVIVHITAIGVTDYIHGSLPYILSLILNRSLKFTTPIFVFLSGITGFYSYRNRDIDYIPFVIKRVKKVLIPYSIWCVLYYAGYIKFGIYGFDIVFFIKSFISGNMSYHLYFVIIIIQLYILGPIFYRLIRKSNNRIMLLILFAAINLLCVKYLNFKLSDRIFLKYMFFYLLGMYVTLEYNKFSSWIQNHKAIVTAGYIISSTFYILVTYYQWKLYSSSWFLFSTISIFFVYLVGLALKDKFIRLYSFIKLFSQSSYYIYLMHPMILTAMIMITENMGILSITKKLIIYSAVVIPVSVILSLSYTKIKNTIKDMRKKNSATLKV